jgi:molybdate transport system ATP-binding protein
MSDLRAAFRGRRGDFVLDAEIDVPAAGITALFGPSGAGKTSVLRAIAGLERFDGRCTLGDAIWQSDETFLVPHRRAVGYVFQEASLFAHLSVADNLRFGLRRAAPPISFGFEAAVELCGLAALLGRSTPELSGGERQRVALGRALLSQPRLLLLDEPLSALDRGARDEIMPYFEALHRTLTIPVLLVTHDIAEVERLADRLILLREGRVVAAGPLNDLLVGDALGVKQARDAASVLPGQVVAFHAADGLSEIAVGGRALLVAGRAGRIGESVRVRIAARDVSLAATRPSATTILNVLSATILAIAPVSDAEAIVTLALGDTTMLARVTRRSLRQLELTVGAEVFAQIKGVSLLAAPRA